MTYGFLVGELVRRVSGRSIGEFFRSEVAEPLGLDFAIGLPDSEHDRVSHLNPAAPPAPGEAVPRFLSWRSREPTSIQGLMMGNTGGYFMPDEWDQPQALSAELPATGGVDERARARGDVPRGGARPARGQRELRSGAHRAHGRRAVAATEDDVLFAPGRWALGFIREPVSPAAFCRPARIVLSEEAFGHIGHGGSIGFADPAATSRSATR